MLAILVILDGIIHKYIVNVVDRDIGIVIVLGRITLGRQIGTRQAPQQQRMRRRIHELVVERDLVSQITGRGNEYFVSQSERSEKWLGPRKISVGAQNVKPLFVGA